MGESHFNFYNSNTNESNLYNNMQQELISQFGIDCRYCVRSNYNPDTLLGEDPSAIFTEEDSFNIRMYPENINEFGGVDELFSKFGISVSNELVLFVQQDKIHQYIGNVPFAGDIVFIPVMNRLFEVLKAEEKNTFYLFGKLMTYKISLRLMEYSQEQLETNMSEIDDIVGDRVVSETLLDNGDDFIMYLSSTVSPTIGDIITGGTYTATVTAVSGQNIALSGPILTSAVTLNEIYSGTATSTYTSREDIISVMDFSESNPFNE